MNEAKEIILTKTNVDASFFLNLKIVFQSAYNLKIGHRVFFVLKILL